jgi:hypothetical protein
MTQAALEFREAEHVCNVGVPTRMYKESRLLDAWRAGDKFGECPEISWTRIPLRVQHSALRRCLRFRQAYDPNPSKVNAGIDR